MTDKHILIIEDEESIGELIEFNLAKNGYKCTRTDAAEKALKMFDGGSRFDLILLDLMLTGMDGTEFCKIFRANKGYPQIPIIMLTARSEEADIVSGLDYGANDYITKPFSPRVLLARIRAQLRDASAASESSETVLSRDGIELNPEFHEVKIGGKPVDLTANEFAILEMFLKAQGRVFTRETIIKNLHGDGYPVTDRAIDVSIVNLRKKLGKKSALIETVRGVGYKMPR